MCYNCSVKQMVVVTAKLNLQCGQFFHFGNGIAMTILDGRAARER